jgi:parvulin-like peptidyl-prolyl isomerase
MIRVFCAVLATLSITLGGVSLPLAKAEVPKQTLAPDVIAKVGDELITFHQINTMLNSSAVVGVSVPALGTPERDVARLTVLDKVITANLLYLDALQQGLDRDPAYQRELKSFADGMLAALYRQRHLAGEIGVSDEEIQDFYAKVVAPETPLDEALRTQIEATVRKGKLQERLVEQRKRLRDDIEVNIVATNFAPAGDAGREDAAPVAEVGDEVITWGEVKALLQAAGRGATLADPLAMETDARLSALQAEIDIRIMAQKARAFGLERDSLYRSRLAEFRKTRLINLHRANLAAQMEPSETQLKAYYEANRGRIMLAEARKIQEVVLETEAEAEALKARLEAGELTLYQAAALYSIAPGAKQHLGEVGWITQGRAQPMLNKVIFGLGPNEIGGPVQSSEGWHLVRVLDVRHAQYEDLEDEATRVRTRRKYIHEQLDAYVVELRREQFAVEVYQDALVRLAQGEANLVKQLAEQALEPGSVTEQRVEELGKLLKP